MRWLLDTCVVSEITYPQPCQEVQNWLKRHHKECALAAASFAEIHYGIACLPHGDKRTRLNAWAASLAQQFEGRILLTDQAVWQQFGTLKASLRQMGRMQDTLDMLIAATALHHNLPLVTRNTRHFQDTGLPLIDLWGNAS